MASFISELKRRNVFKAGVAYTIVGAMGNGEEPGVISRFFGWLKKVACTIEGGDSLK